MHHMGLLFLSDVFPVVDCLRVNVLESCANVSLPMSLPLLAHAVWLSLLDWSRAVRSGAGSDDMDTDWDRELGLVGPGTGRTGEPSPNNTRDLKRANIAEGLKALLRGSAEPAPQPGKT